MTIIAPQTLAHWAAYYRLRYEVLRQPWQQPPGSERAPDDDAPTTTHALLLPAATPNMADAVQAIGVGRLHAAAPGQGQLRFMAVAPAWQGRGVGRQLLEHLEAAACHQQLHEMVLHARAEAVPFYERAGYAVVAPSHLLFGHIPHFLMRKQLASY